EAQTTDSRWQYTNTFSGVIPNLQRNFTETDSESKREELSRFMRETPCNSCKGRRLKDEALAVLIDSMSIMDVCDLSIDSCYESFRNLKLSETEKYIAKSVLKEVLSRLEFLKNVGLNYLTLNRVSATLSGGEAQRIRLATQIGSNLTGVLYVLDEPTIGLHQRDNAKLIVRGAAENNLKNIDVEFPLGMMIAVTGVSGSGKSTLVNDILYKALASHFYGSVGRAGRHKGILGLENIDKAIGIDQSPIGR